jgi:hypothetical protein
MKKGIFIFCAIVLLSLKGYSQFAYHAVSTGNTRYQAIDLKIYAGEYVAEAKNATLNENLVSKVYIKNDVLMMVIPDPNEPDRELVPTNKKHEFDFKDEKLKSKGFSIKFDVSENKATALYMVVPLGSLQFKRKN